MNQFRHPTHLYTFGPFTLDTVERVLVRDGQVVPLPAKAINTLLVLVRNSGHVVEKEQLMREVWLDEIVEEGNLAHNVCTLRKALGETAGSSQYIETIPRRGYRFLQSVGPLDHRDVEDRSNAHAEPPQSVTIVRFRSGSPMLDHLADNLTQLGRYGEAYTTFERAEQIAEQCGDTGAAQRARTIKTEILAHLSDQLKCAQQMLFALEDEAVKREYADSRTSSETQSSTFH